MIPIGKLLLAAFISAAAFGLWRFFQFVYRIFTSPMRHLRGPKATSWVFGNARDMYLAENSVVHGEWVKQYGSTFTYKGFFCTSRLFTMDTRAINHVLTHSSDYQRPFQVRYNLSQILGDGLIVVEGAQHRQQRRIMNPAFGPAQIRALTDIFHAKAIRLRNIWLSEIARDPAGTITGARLDVMLWLSRMTLDVIGLAGFNYNIDSLNANEKPNELNEAFATMTAASQRQSILPLLQARFPPLRLLPSDRARRVQVARHTMARIGKELLSDAKMAARANVTEKGAIEKNSLHEVPTFLVAGYETTSAATTWALYAMTIEPGIQTELREELLSVDTDTPSMDDLMALPYLDAVVRETLRVHSPVPSTVRIAMKDDVLLFARPFTDKYGIIHDSISIRKGDRIFIPILAMNRSHELWGPDAHEFKPERWQNIPEAVPQIPGVWGHQLTFLGGPRACIGYRFSLVEMKALLFTLIRAFEFELAVPASEIGISPPVHRPVLCSDPKSRPQLPLLVKPYQRT